MNRKLQRQHQKLRGHLTLLPCSSKLILQRLNPLDRTFLTAQSWRSLVRNSPRVKSKRFKKFIEFSTFYFTVILPRWLQSDKNNQFNVMHMFLAKFYTENHFFKKCYYIYYRQQRNNLLLEIYSFITNSLLSEPTKLFIIKL